MAATVTEEKKEKKSISDAIADFIQNNRRGILITLAIIVVVVAGCIAGFAIRSALHDKALSALEDFSGRYDKLVMDFNEPEKAADVQTLLDEITAFAAKAVRFCRGPGLFYGGFYLCRKKGLGPGGKSLGRFGAERCQNLPGSGIFI